jgi:hypothetical protein
MTMREQASALQGSNDDLNAFFFALAICVEPNFWFFRRFVWVIHTSEVLEFACESAL